MHKLGDVRAFRKMLNVAKIPVDMGNPDPGTDVLEAHVIEEIEHVFEQADLPLVGRSEIGMAALGAVCPVTDSIPREKGLAEACARGDNGNGSSENRFAAINGL